MHLKTAALIGTLAASLVFPGNAKAQEDRQIWEAPHDVSLAMRNPDLFAWKLFLSAVWPADLETRAADPDRFPGDEGPMVFESWVIQEDVYLDNGATSYPWDEQADVEVRVLGTGIAVQQQLIRDAEPCHPVTSAISTKRSG